MSSAGVAMMQVSNMEISFLHLLTQMWTIVFSIKWYITIGYNNDGDFPILAGCQNRIGKLPIWENMEKKEMKKDNPYKLNKAMTSPLAWCGDNLNVNIFCCYKECIMAHGSERFASNVLNPPAGPAGDHHYLHLSQLTHYCHTWWVLSG